MKPVKSPRMLIDQLEQRRMLAATLLSALPTASLQLAQSTQTVALSNYFKDSAVTAGNTVVDLQTNLPAPDNSIPLQLSTAATPITVSNFLKYITSGEYANSVVHRSVPGFVLQAGGYSTAGSHITTFGNINGESSTEMYNNSTGTIAMALSTGPNSGTSEWYINLANNPILDGTADGGPFTAFGKVLYRGLTVANDIAALPLVNDTSVSAWNTLPVKSGSNGATVTTEPVSNLITINPVIVADGLNFTVTSSNPAVATASASGGSLSLTPVAAGSTNITVTATDLGGGTVSSTFAVNVAGAVVLPILSVGNATGIAGRDSQVVFPVTLSAAASSAVTLSYTLSAGSASAADFSATGHVLTIPAGATNVTLPVTLIGDSSGAAETFSLTLGSLSSNAVFSGGLATATATGTINPFVIATTTTTVVASAASVAVNGPESFTATVVSVDGTTAAGTVTFSIGGTSIGTAALANGVASFSSDLTAPGNEIVTAAYTGDTTHAASTSAPLTVNVTTLTPVVAKSTIPAALVTGTAVRGVSIVGVTNNTAATEKGIITVSVYASTSGAIDQTAVLLGSIKRSVNIVSGKSVSIAVLTKTSASALAAGSYTLLTQTTDTDSITSNAATGPTLVVSAANISLVETFSKLTLPTAVVAGSKTSAVALIKITNHGNVPSVGVTPISLYASADQTVANGTLIKMLSKKLSIGVGKSVTVAIPLTAFPLLADGDYYIVAQASDPKGVVTQAVFPTPVNIAAARVDLSGTITSVPTSHLTKSFPVTLQIADAGNYTVIKAIDLTLGVSASSDGSSAALLTTLPIKLNLKANGNQTLHLKLPIPKGTPTGAEYLVVVIDPFNVIADSDRTNNTLVSSSTLNFG